MNRIKLSDNNISPNQKRLRLMELSGIPLTEDEKKKLKPRTESVSMVEPSKYHDRVSPTSKIMKTFQNQNIEDLDDDDEIDLQELIDELEDEITLEEILEEMGYYNV